MLDTCDGVRDALQAVVRHGQHRRQRRSPAPPCVSGKGWDVSRSALGTAPLTDAV